MAVELPSRTTAAGARRARVRVPDAGDVQTVGVSRDPGLRVPKGAFDAGGDALVEAGRGLVDFSESVKREADRQQRDFDALKTTEAEIAFAREAREELEKRKSTGDPTLPAFQSDYRNWLKEQAEKRVADLPPEVSERARKFSFLEMQKQAASLDTAAGLTVIDAERKAAEDAIAAKRNVLAEQAYTYPEAVDDVLNDGQAAVSKFSDKITQNRERDENAVTRAEILESSVRGLIDQGKFADAEKRLTEKKYAEDWSQGQRETLRRAIKVARDREKREKDRAERERIAELRDDVRDAVTVLESGNVPPGLDDLKKAARGTELSDSLRDAEEDADTMAEFNAAPLAEQREQMAQIAGQETKTARDVRMMDRMARAHSTHVKAVKQDPLAHGAAVGLYELVPIDYDEPATLKRRLRKARLAEEHFGVDVPPLTAGEAKALKDNIDKLSADQVTGFFSTLVRGAGEDGAIVIGGQVAGDDPATGLAIARSADSPLVSAEIVHGRRLLKEAKPELPAASVRTDVDAVYGNMFQEVPGALAAHIEAAKAVYAARKVPTGDLTYDSDLFQQALAMAAGGAIGADGQSGGGPIEYNGQVILPPVAGMDEDGFTSLVENIDTGAMARFGNGAPQYGDGTPFDPGLFDTGFMGGSEAQFVTTGFGRYRVFVPGLGYLQTEAGTLYEIDLGRMAREAVPAR